MDQIIAPKSRDRVRTRARILAAAIDAFSELGYSQAGIRDIASRAGITSPMLLHYFGSKIGLFEAALVEAMSNEDHLGFAREDFGKHLTSFFANPDIQIRPPSMIVLSTGDADARAVTARVLEEHVVLPLAEWLGHPDGYARATQITMLSLSYVLFTRQVPLVPLGSDAEDKLFQWMGESIQRIVDQK